MDDYEVSDVQSDDTLGHFALLSYCNPITFQEIVKDTRWQKAMDEEIKSIDKNDTLELRELLKRQKFIGVK